LGTFSRSSVSLLKWFLRYCLAYMCLCFIKGDSKSGGGGGMANNIFFTSREYIYIYDCVCKLCVTVCVSVCTTKRWTSCYIYTVCRIWVWNKKSDFVEVSWRYHFFKFTKFGYVWRDIGIFKYIGLFFFGISFKSFFLHLKK